MELSPPPWFAPLVSLAGGVGVVLGAAVALAGTPVGVRIVGVLLAIGGAVLAAVGGIGRRHVEVVAGRLTVTGPGRHTFALAELRPPLRVGPFGVRLTDGTTARRVFAQLPDPAMLLVARLPEWAPHLAPPPAFPVVLPGRPGLPVAGLGVAALAATTGVVGALDALRGTAPPLAGAAALLLVVAGGATTWWVVTRVDQRVAVHRDHLDHVRLVGRHRRALDGLAAAAVVTEPRRLPRSTLHRQVHRLRLVDRDGGVVELAPMLVALPFLGSVGAGVMMWRRARVLHQLHGLAAPAAALVRSRGGTVAVWELGEVAPGVTRTAFVLRRPAGGRHVVPATNGWAVGGDHPPRLVLVHDGTTLVVVDGASVRTWHAPGRVVAVEPGFDRVEVTTDHRREVHSLARIEDAAADGWSGLDDVMTAAPAVPWLAPLERVGQAVARTGPERALLEVGALALLEHRLRRGLAEEIAPPPLADVLELQRRLGPSAHCPGGDLDPLEGADGRPECRTCGRATTGGVSRPHPWPVRDDHCGGGLCAPSARARHTLTGPCRTCGRALPLTHDGLVRPHHGP